jgi:hypothetical protein
MQHTLSAHGRPLGKQQVAFVRQAASSRMVINEDRAPWARSARFHSAMARDEISQAHGPDANN